MPATPPSRYSNVVLSKMKDNEVNKGISEDKSQKRSAADAGNNKQTKSAADAIERVQTTKASGAGDQLQPKYSVDAGDQLQTKSSVDAGDHIHTKSAAGAGDHAMKYEVNVNDAIPTKSAVYYKERLQKVTKLNEDTRGLIFQPEDFETEVDTLWPFPFSENPSDWDIKEFPKNAYLELFDPYDPFLSADTLLSHTFPGSLQLDIERWNRYLEENEEIAGNCIDNPDPFKPLKDNNEDDISISPLPLKQTLCRLLNVHLQTSESGDIITGDLITEVTSATDNNEVEENVEDRELLTNEMAMQINQVLNETEKDKDLNQQITNHLIDSILDEIIHDKNIKTAKSQKAEVENSKSEVYETETTEKEFSLEENCDAETFDREIYIVKTTDTEAISSVTTVPEKHQQVPLEIETTSKSELCLSQNPSDISSMKNDVPSDSVINVKDANDFSEHTFNESNKIPYIRQKTTDTEQKTFKAEKEFDADAKGGSNFKEKAFKNRLGISHNTRSRSRASKLL
ncbi:uncharacterized protein LOC128546047 [Mercenaria mercenaria]|uniref:uncharacterized protein LOC128546047 n=1 Tax=Mercenaria mercenaria TaxID=6596 RepID=UPI00234F6319|nr:uncharacterized protein LOC128546047 [Mercenaria mercenaria]